LSFSFQRHWLIIAGCILGVVLVALPAILRSVTSKRVAADLSKDEELDQFFKTYWQRPIPPQGPAPSSFTDKEASLAPEACGSCHTRQYADWKESLHSKAMGPGPWGQIVDLTRNSPEEAVQCMTCHAPLSEQGSLAATAGQGDKEAYEKNPDLQLHLMGITCAACHVRQNRRFGPPKAEGSAATKYPAGMPSHGGAERTPYLEKAGFCKDCHQFDPENSLLVNGKPMQDTYREWKESIWGKGEAACQDCHMPGRRHFWKGIHDKEWVKEGVRIEAELKKPASGGPLELFVVMTNAAVGHKFPTYITPKVFVRAAFVDDRGRVVKGTMQEKIIGWGVRFEGGEWRERFDTRIPPGKKAESIFRWDAPIEAKTVRAWVEVYPDDFYHNHFYPAYLQSESISASGRRLIRKALEDSEYSYLLFEKTMLLD